MTVTVTYHRIALGFINCIYHKLTVQVIGLYIIKSPAWLARPT